MGNTESGDVTAKDDSESEDAVSSQDQLNDAELSAVQGGNHPFGPVPGSDPYGPEDYDQSGQPF